MAGPLTPLFVNAALDVGKAGLDFAVNPQRTMDQITNAPRNMFGG